MNIVQGNGSSFIAIDLGISKSSISGWTGESLQIIPITPQNYDISSLVAVEQNDEVLVGDFVCSISNEQCKLISCLKYCIGKEIYDISFQSICKRYGLDSFSVPLINSNIQQYARRYYALLLARIKRIAEIHLGNSVDGALISVPCIFGMQQREETIYCAQLAGFNQVRLISDCAAISMNEFISPLGNEEIVLVVDFGCGYTSATISSLDDKFADTLGAHGSEDWSGFQMDFLLCEYLERKHHLNISSNSPLKTKLMELCRNAKEQLSFEESVTINFTVSEEHQITTSLTRELFLNICKSVFQVFMDCVKQAKRISRKKKKDIQRVVLSGGSSKIPHVTELLKNYFGWNIPIKHVERGVIQGMSFYGTSLFSSNPDVVYLDSSTQSIGIETAGGICHFLFQKGTTLHSLKKEVFTTYTDSSQGPSISVYEGEATFSKDNKFVNRAHIMGVRPAPRGVPQIELTFKLNRDGILEITGFEKVASHSLTIQWQRPCYELKDRDEFRKKYGTLAVGEAPWKVKRLLWLGKIKEGSPLSRLPLDIIRHIIHML